MTPIVVCSILALVIIIERSHTLQFNKIVPTRLREQLITRLRENGDIGRTQLMNVKEKTALGDILATGLLYRQYGLESMTMHMQNRASVQVHQLEKNINMLGTIGAIAPLLGLLGTVLGIISSFLAITDGAMQEAGSNRDMLFVIAADANATHQSVVRVMDVAGKLGFLNLNISTVVPLGQTLPQ